MPRIIMYTTGFCPYCVAAKNLLQTKGASWDEIRIDKERGKRDEMIDKSQRRTVPQIFIGDTHVGGFDDLAALDKAGELDQLLASA